jgi:hypothetical protein
MPDTRRCLDAKLAEDSSSTVFDHIPEFMHNRLSFVYQRRSSIVMREERCT